MKRTHDHYILQSNASLEQASELTNEILVARKFYSTNATYPREINYLAPHPSPLRSFHHLSSVERVEGEQYLDQVTDWHPLRVTQDTGVWFYSKTKGRLPSKRRPCYLASMIMIHV